MTELLWSTLTRLSERLRLREISSVEVLEATLRRIDETEPRVHAYAGVMEATARKEAAAADSALGKGRALGPLHGIPIGVKDLLHTAGFPTTAGSAVLEGFVPSTDATVVRRLREGGAVVVGKTVTHEFAYGQDVPETRNAWDTLCYPGGSSAGSGVAVAVGSAYGAIGTDTGGSIRVPAAVNGVVGLKPTHGRVSRRGVIPMSPSLDTVGPLARTVADCAAILAAIAGHDRGDATTIDEAVPDYAHAIVQGVAGLRVGVERSYFFYEAVSDNVRTAVDEALITLGDLGITVVEVEVDDLDLAVPAGMSVLLGDTSEWHQTLLRKHPTKYVPETRVMLELGELLLATSYARAQKLRAVVQRSVRRAFESQRLDALIAPTLPVTTMPIEQLSVDLTGRGESALSAFIHHCFLANVVGIPSLSVPVGFDPNSHPIGMQLFGRPFDEAALFRIGHAYQMATSWHEAHPDFVR